MEKKSKSICIVSPFPPPYGGMAIQAEKMMSLLRNDGFRVLPVRTNPSLQPGFISNMKGLRTFIGVLRFLGNLKMALNQTDIVYFLTGFFDFFFWVTYPALILIKMSRKKVILSARGGEAALFFKKYQWLIKPIMKSVDTISVPSSFLEGVFRETFNIRATVVPNIADLEQFVFRERMTLRPKLIVTRNLERMYNVACVVKAFKEVHDRFPESILGIIGDGPERSELEELVGELGLKNCTTFYGVIPHAQIQNYYDEYDIFLNASNVDNLPGVILEAFACGLPVVSTKSGGIPYIVRDGFTGLLVEKEDFKGMASQVGKLLENPETALTLTRNARKECEKFSWGSIRKVLYPLLERSL